MKIFPAIDLFEGKAVRLYKGDYSKLTVYSENPPEVAVRFNQEGATNLHLVDLEGAKYGTTPNIEVVKDIRKAFCGFIELGGGIRTMDVIDRYIDAGVDRVILGTAAVTDRALLTSAIEKYGEKIAVGVDMRGGKVAINGWCEETELDAIDFCVELESLGVKTVICTDISRDGAMQGTNRDLYARLSSVVNINIVASGGVSTLADVQALAEGKIYGAIIGKAYYTGAVSLSEAVRIAENDN